MTSDVVPAPGPSEVDPRVSAYFAEGVPLPGSTPTRAGGDVLGQHRRQRAVDSLAVQVHGPTERFDRIARIAHGTFGVPVVSIGVIDGDHALFPGAYGFEDRQMPRDGVLGELFLAEEPVMREDLRLDPELMDHPVISELGIVFYAGRPLKDQFDNVVGALSLFDFESRTLDEDQLGLLDDLAAWAQQELVSSGEIVQASRIQAALVPAAPVRCDAWQIEGMCVPSLAVGGDFFDYEVVGSRAFLALGDVMGKGIGAALLCAGVRGALRGSRGAVSSEADLGQRITTLASTFYDDLERSESFVTLFDATIDLDDGATRWVDAGSGLCLVARADGTVEWLRGQDGPIGVQSDDTWSEHRTVLEPGERMLVCSDGLIELLEGDDTWSQAVEGLLLAHADPSDLLGAISELAERRALLDDVTVVVVART